MPQASEERSRAAVDALVKGHLQNQIQSGVAVPSTLQAEQFAKEIVRETVRQKEEGALEPKVPAGKKEILPPDKLSRGEVGPDSKVIDRFIGNVDQVRKEKERRKAQENPRLRARLDMLGKMPEWEERLYRAALEGETFAKKLGLSGLERYPVVADFVINEVEKSNALFGDWRLPPKIRDRRIIVGA